MNKNDTIHERITAVVNEISNGNNSLFASIIGTNEGNIRGYRKNIQPKADVLEKIVKNTEVNPDWLLTGRGEMLKKGNDSCDDLSLRMKNVELSTYKVLVSNLERKIKVMQHQIDELEQANEDLTRQLLAKDQSIV